jgi:hypothetical protein
MGYFKQKMIEEMDARIFPNESNEIPSDYYEHVISELNQEIKSLKKEIKAYKQFSNYLYEIK